MPSQAVGMPSQAVSLAKSGLIKLMLGLSAKR